eukprot:318865-Amphidinium_carterae.1
MAMRKALRCGIEGAAAETGTVASAVLSGKGDDSRSHHLSLARALMAAGGAMRSGVVFAPDKSHVAIGFLEAERCMVDRSGYFHSVARRIGNSVVAETQGSERLTASAFCEYSVDLGDYLARHGMMQDHVRAVRNAILHTADLQDLPDVRGAWYDNPRPFGGFGGKAFDVLAGEMPTRMCVAKPVEEQLLV